MVPTFSMFVDMVLSIDFSNLKDPHLRPYWEKCDVCALDFDAIGKTESWTEDTAYILHRVRSLKL